MRASRRHARVEMGEAINFEDVLTVMTVLLLLRLIFMVPLVNLDKAKTVAARADAFWERAALFVHGHPGDSAGVAPYRASFDLHGLPAILSASGGEKGVAWIEAVAADSGMTVVRHDRATGRFAAMNAQGRGHTLSFRHGSLLWSKAEGEWFVASDSLDYGTREESKAMEKEYRAWVKEKRGF